MSLTGDAGEATSVLAQPKRLAVLTYVAIESSRGFVRRDALLALFWPDLRDDQARQALRQTLYQLRLALGEDVFVGRAPDELTVDRGILWCDAVAFAEAIREDHLEEGLALYHGDFLPGFFLANQSSEFEQWLDGARAGYRSEAARAAGALAKRTAAFSSPDQAVAWAQQAARLAPDDEGATRQLIEVLERVGNRAGALRIYDDFSRRLLTEYGTRPAAATEALIAKIRTHEHAGSDARRFAASVPSGNTQRSPRPLEPPTPEPPGTRLPPHADAAPAPESSAIGGEEGAAVHRGRFASPIARWGAGALLGCLIIAGIVLARARMARQSASPTIPTLAVLPFDKQGGGDDSYVADGLGDEVRGRLAELAGVRVIAGGSSRQYAATSKTVQQIGKELGVQYILSGRVVWARAGGRPDSVRIRISPELVRTSDGTTAWASVFDVVPSDISPVPGEIAKGTAAALQVSLDPGARSDLARPATRNAAAYDAYLRGAALFRVGPADVVLLHRAVADLEQAVALDTSYVRAWALLSTVRARLYINSGSMKRDDLVRARVAAERALALAPTLAAAHGAMATYYDAINDMPGKLREYRAGLTASPGDATMVSGLADIERKEGHWETAIRYTREAGILNPRSATPPYNLALSYLYLHRYREAVAASDQDLSLGGADSPEDWELATIIRLSQGDLQGGRAVLARAAQAVDPTAVTAFVASYGDLEWALDEHQQEFLRRLTPASFGDDRFLWSYALMSVAGLRGDRPAVRAFADTARREALATLVNVPTDAQTHALLGVIDATLGRRAEAVEEGTRAATLAPLRTDAITGPYVFEQLARIYMLVGDTARAVSALDSLTTIPYYVTPAWLRIDPTWGPLRDNAAFKRLIARPIEVERPIG